MFNLPPDPTPYDFFVQVIVPLAVPFITGLLAERTWEITTIVKPKQKISADNNDGNQIMPQQSAGGDATSTATQQQASQETTGQGNAPTQVGVVNGDFINNPPPPHQGTTSWPEGLIFEQNDFVDEMEFVLRRNSIEYDFGVRYGRGCNMLNQGRIASAASNFHGAILAVESFFLDPSIYNEHFKEGYIEALKDGINELKQFIDSDSEDRRELERIAKGIQTTLRRMFDYIP